MTLGELLEHLETSFAGAADAPAAFALLTGRPGAWRVSETRPVLGVRLGEDEVLVETGDPAQAGVSPGQLTAGEVLTRLEALATAHADRPVEACEPAVEVGEGTRVRVDYSVDAFGRDESTGTCLLICLAESDPA